MKKRNLITVISIVLMFCLLAACSTDTNQTGGSDTQESKKELTIAMVGDVQTWNPYTYNEVIANSIQKHVFNTLIEVDKDLKTVPSLALSWESSDDSKVWTFKLREGVKFHNGNPFTAEDVVFSLDTCLKTNKGWIDAMATTKSYKALDDFTLEITCTDSDAILPASIGNIMILDKETCEGKELDFLETTVIGTGRYKLEEYKKDDKTILVRNGDYWGDKPEAEKVTFRAIPNDGTRTASLVANEVDFIGNVPVRDAEMLKTKDFINLVSEQSAGVMFFNMAQIKENPSKDAAQPIKSPDGSNPMYKIEVRKAIIHAINEKEIIEKVMNGYATVADTIIPKGFNGYNENIKKYEYNPEISEKLLDEAGYPRQGDGYRFEITLDATNDRYINDAAVATAVASYLEKVGIKCNLNLMSRSMFFSYIRIHDETDNTHFLMSGWSDSSGESVLYAKDLLYSTTLEGRKKENFGGANRGYYSNDKVDTLIDKALATSNWEERNSIMKEVWQIAHDDAAIFSTHFTNDIYAVNKRVNYTPNMLQFIYAWDFTFN